MRYFKLLRLFLKSSLLIDLEYRADFLTALLMTALDIVWSVGTAIVFYTHRDSIGGWRFHEALIVIGLFFVILAIVDAFIFPNVQELGQHIRKGTLDFVLIKPVGSQLHATLRRYKVPRLSNGIAGLIIIGYALAQLGWQPQALQLLLFIALFVAAAIILYSIMVMLASITFWAVQMDNIQELFFAFFEAAKYPASAFPQPVRFIITFIIPVAFLTSVPAEAILNRVTPQLAAYGCVLAAVLLFLCTHFWRIAVRSYSSASS
jgi:ABC-2 type transport system permease protein